MRMGSVNDSKGFSQRRYHRTTVNLLPDQELFIETEAKKRHTTQRQVIIDAIRSYQKIVSGEDLTKLYYDPIHEMVAKMGQDIATRIENDVHQTLYRSFYGAIKDRFQPLQEYTLATAMMTATMLTDVAGEEGTPADMLTRYIARAKQLIDQIEKEKKQKERD